MATIPICPSCQQPIRTERVTEQRLTRTLNYPILVNWKIGTGGKVCALERAH